MSFLHRGWGQQPLAEGATEGSNMDSEGTDTRIEKLLDQLENPNLTEQEIERIKQKIDVLQQVG